MFENRSPLKKDGVSLGSGKECLQFRCEFFKEFVVEKGMNK